MSGQYIARWMQVKHVHIPPAATAVRYYECSYRSCRLAHSALGSKHSAKCASQTAGTTNLAGLCRVHCDRSVAQQVLQLQSFNKVGVPDHAAILNAHILKGCYTLINLLAAILQGFLCPEHCCIILHKTSKILVTDDLPRGFMAV